MIVTLLIYNKARFLVKNMIVLYNYERIYNNSVCDTFINVIKKSDSSLCTKGASPSCSDQSDLNVPDIIIITSQLINTNLQEDLNTPLGSHQCKFVEFNFSRLYCQPGENHKSDCLEK